MAAKDMLHKIFRIPNKKPKAAQKLPDPILGMYDDEGILGAKPGMVKGKKGEMLTVKQAKEQAKKEEAEVQATIVYKPVAEEIEKYNETQVLSGLEVPSEIHINAMIRKAKTELYSAEADKKTARRVFNTTKSVGISGIFCFVPLAITHHFYSFPKIYAALATLLVTALMFMRYEAKMKNESKIKREIIEAVKQNKGIEGIKDKLPQVMHDDDLRQILKKLKNGYRSFVPESTMGGIATAKMILDELEKLDNRAFVNERKEDLQRQAQLPKGHGPIIP